MRIKMRATELVDGDAEFISLVGTGAIRQPFKIIKSEDEDDGQNKKKGGTVMESLTRMFHRQDRLLKAEIVPELLAVAVAPDMDLEKVVALLAKAELHTDEVQEMFEGDGEDRKLAATLYIQKGATAFEDAGEHQVNVGISAGITAVCLVREKSFMPFADTETFGDAMKAQGFFPSFRLASEVLEDKLFEISMKAATPEDMATMLDVATKDFGGALISMAKSLPAEVFKLDAVVRKGSDDPVTGTGASGDGEADALPNEVSPGSSLPAGSSGVKGAMKNQDDPDEDAEKAKKKGKDADAGEKSQLDKLMAAVEGIAKTVEEGLSGVTKEVTDLGKRVAQAESVAKSADEATRGRVRSSGESEEGTGFVRKDDGEAYIPLIDSARDREPLN